MAKLGPEMWKPLDWSDRRRSAVGEYQKFVHGYTEDWNTAIDHGAEAMAEVLVPLLEKILSAYFDGIKGLPSVMVCARETLDRGSRRIE